MVAHRVWTRRKAAAQVAPAEQAGPEAEDGLEAETPALAAEEEAQG